MNINNIFAGNGLQFFATDGARFSSPGKSSVTNPAFRRDSVSLGNTAPAFQTYMPAVTQRLNNPSTAGKCIREAIRNNNNRMIEIDSAAFHRVFAARDSGNYLFSSAAVFNSGTYTANVLWSETSTPERPIVIVRGEGPDGTTFEKKVDINKVNPRNATFIEKIALQGYFAATGTSFCQRIVLSPVGGDIFTSRFDFVTWNHMLLQSQPRGSHSYQQVSEMVRPFIDHLINTGQYTYEQLLYFLKYLDPFAFNPNFGIPDLEQYLLDMMDERDMSLIPVERKADEPDGLLGYDIETLREIVGL